MDTSSAPRAVFTLGTLAFNPVDGVVQLALDRAGTLLAASSPPGRVHLYDLPDGSPRPPLLGAPEDRSWWQSPSVVTRSLAVSPDGGSVAMHQGGRLCLWSAADGALRWSAELASSSPRAVAFADERTLLVGGCGDALRSYDALTGALRWARELPQRDGRPPVHLALATSPDGRRLFAATHERSHVVSVDDGAVLATINAPRVSGTLQQGAARFSADGATALLAIDDAGVRAWDAASGKRRWTNGALRKRLPVIVNGIAWVGDDRVLVSVRERAPLLLDARTGRRLAHELPRFGPLAVTDDARVAVLICHGSAQVHDLAAGGERRTFRTGAGVAVGFADGGATLQTGTVEGTLERWDWRANAPLDARPLAARALSCTGRYAAVTDGARKGWGLHDLQQGRVVAKIDAEPHSDDFAFAPDDEAVYHADYTLGVTEVSLPSGRKRALVVAGGTSSLAPQRSRDGAVMATVGSDGVLRWRVGHGPWTGSSSKHAYQCIALDPEGRWVVLPSEDGSTLQRWDLTSDAAVATVAAEGFVWKLAVDPTGTRIAAAYATRVELRDAETLALLAVLPETSYPMTFAPDGRHLVTGRPCVRVWDLEGSAP